MGKQIRPVLRERFKRGINNTAQKYIASIDYDARLYNEDIEGSIAHVEMLASIGLIKKGDSKKIINGLNAIRKEIDDKSFVFMPELEDIHMHIERRLFDKIGAIAAFMHTARSRNDQIALDIRMYLKKEITKSILELLDVQEAILVVARDNIDVIMPGYTHLQHAQPVLFSHHMMAYFEMFQRDIERFKDCYKRTDISPIGSGALAGVAYPINREMVAQKLGFAGISRNSIDAVSDRDFIIEFESAATICMMHLSRMAEEFIIWSSTEFNFIEIDEAFCTSSSIMPQKKNPDVLELIRGRTGRTVGNLIALLMVMKALPLAYNRDMQEDKITLFSTVDILLPSLQLIKDIISSISLKKGDMFMAAGKNYILATDIADYLVKKGVPFREAHTIVSKLINYAINKKKSLEQLSLEEYKKFSANFGRDVFNISISQSVNSRNHPGGTSTSQVKKSIAHARKLSGGP
jgi:argininosuccinate lyase